MWMHEIPVAEADWRRVVVTDLDGHALTIAVRLQGGRIKVSLDDPGRHFRFAPQHHADGREWVAVELGTKPRTA